jgi:hypothetical protein
MMILSVAQHVVIRELKEEDETFSKKKQKYHDLSICHGISVSKFPRFFYYVIKNGHPL